MAISRIKEDSLTEVYLQDKEVLKGKKANSDKEESSDPDNKKESFLKSIIVEIKKVEWPGYKYVINWTLVILVFTAIFSLSLGFFDHIFNNSIRFIACTSLEGNNQTIGNCLQEYGQRMMFRGD